MPPLYVYPQTLLSHPSTPPHAQMVNVAAQQHLRTVALDEPGVEEARSAVAAVLERNMGAPRALLASFGEFSELVEAQVCGRCAAYKRLM